LAETDAQNDKVEAVKKRDSIQVMIVVRNQGIGNRAGLGGPDSRFQDCPEKTDLRIVEDYGPQVSEARILTPSIVCRK
jgi:hypothetical protein